MKKIFTAVFCISALAIFVSCQDSSAQQSVIERDLTGVTFTDPEEELGLTEKHGMLAGNDLYATHYGVKGENGYLAENAKLLLLSKSADGVYTVLEDVKIDCTPGAYFALRDLVNETNWTNQYDTFSTYILNDDGMEVIEMYKVMHGDSKFTIKKPEPGSNYQEYQP